MEALSRQFKVALPWELLYSDEDDLINTHTHNRFTVLSDFVRDYPDEPAQER